MKRIEKIRLVLLCFLLLGFSTLLYGANNYRSLTNFNKEIEVVDEVKYRYDSNGYSGLDITLNSLKTGEAAAATNTIKLQDAMNKVSDAGGGTVYLPSGTYYFGLGGVNSSSEKEDFAIKCRNNVHLKGKGVDENSSNYTVLKPLYNNPSANGGMDMFYFNNYKDSGFGSTNYNTSSLVNVSYVDPSGKTITWNNQTVYLINADFSDFVIDGDSARGGIKKGGGTYRTDGKGFMINLFSDCDWNNVVVKNVDATGFGVDCPINSTIKNCKAINCGKAATQSDGGASGFGIGTGYSNEESLVIENSIALNNKKFGFFFEHQARFSDVHYKATTSKGFVVKDSIAGGNMYDFGGLKAYDVSYENNKSISNLGSYKVDGLKATNTDSGTYEYGSISFNSGKLKLNKVVQPIFYSMYTTNSLSVNTDVFYMIDDVDSYTSEVKWAVNSGIIPVNSATKFSPDASISRIDVVKSLYAFNGYDASVNNNSTNNDRSKHRNIINSIGYSDLNNSYDDDLDSVVWAYNKGIISKDTAFNPSVACTRAQLVTMLYRMDGSPQVSGSNPFTDTKEGSWYYNAILWGYNNGVIKGTTGGKFSPDAKLTKSQLAIFLYRYKNVTKQNFKFKVNVIGGVNNNGSVYNRNTKYTLVNPTRSGFTFLGWTGSNGKTPNKNVVINSGTTGNLSYTANWKPELINIFIKKEATTKAYRVGSKVSTSGLVVGGTYGDNNITEIKDYTISPSVLDKTGEQVVTISYGGLSTSYTVTVSDTSISKISVSKNPNKVSYFIGDKVDTTGLELKVTYDNGTSGVINNGYSISPEILNKPGTNKVTVKYGGKSTNFEVTVKEIGVKSVKIKTYPKKLVYYVGEYLNTDGLLLEVTYSEGSIKEINSGYSINNRLLGVVGEKTIIINYKDKTCSFKVNVKEEKTTSIKIYELPKKINYFVGDKFNSSGLKLAVYKDSGYQDVISSGFNVSLDNNHIFENKGIVNVNVSYGSYNTSFNVNVYDVVDQVLSLTSRPNKINYVVGEKFDSTGIILELVNGDGIKTKVSDYTLSIQNGSLLNDVGVKTVYVSAGDKSTSFDINVSKVVSLEVNRLSEKYEYKLGESFNPKDIVVVAEYNDGIKERLSGKYKVEVEGGSKFTSPGEKEVKVIYGDVSSTFKIMVEDSRVKEEGFSINTLVIIAIIIGGLFAFLGISDAIRNKNNNKKEPPISRIG